MALNQETMNAFKDILGQHTSELKKEFSEQVKGIKKDNAELRKEFNEQVKLIKQDNAENTEQIKESIAGLSSKVAQNTENINGIDGRVVNIEKEVREIQDRMAQVEAGPANLKEQRMHITKTNEMDLEMQEKLDNTRAQITRAARKIVGITPIDEQDLERTSNPILSEGDNLYFAAIEFLHLELGYEMDECKELDILKVTRPRKPNTNRLYIHFATEKSAEYLHRMVRIINSRRGDDEEPRPNSKMFIPPQLHNRYADLSKLCYNKRQEDKQCKTRISLGEEDLILEIKKQGEQWENVDINSMGQISLPEWHKVWPTQRTPNIDSLPRGRYASQKRERVIYSTDEDEIEPQGEDKRMREKSPTLHTDGTQINDTNNQNGTPNDDEETPNIPQDPCMGSVQQKVVQAELWGAIFQGKPKNEDTTNNAASKNGGSTKGKGSRGQPKKSKGGKEQQTSATK